MFKRLVNEAQLRFTLQTAGPLLIRQGDETPLDPLRPDMQFVRTAHPETGEPTVFLPGSSLKGVFRARAEQLLRGILTNTELHVCDLGAEKTCGKAKNPPADGTGRYTAHCPVCQLFGSFQLGSRIAFCDALPAKGAPPVMGRRTNVRINRISGGAQGKALFSPEIVESGRFMCQLTLANYATWQLGVVLWILDDLHLGFLGIGGGTSRGFGRVTVADRELTLRDYRPAVPTQVTGYREADALPVPVTFVRRYFGHEATLPVDDLRMAFQQFDWVAALRADREGAGQVG